MSSRDRHLYEFGPYVLNANERLLLHKGESVPLAPKAFDTLLVLVQNGGHLVEKEDLMKFVWPDVMVEEANISLNISSVRKALGDNTSEPLYIATVSKRGYRFIAPVRVITDEEAPPAIKPLLDEEKSNGNRNIDQGTPGQYQEEEGGKQPEPIASEPDQAGVGRSAALLPSPFGGHLWHALASSTLYALLYTVALFIEVSYQYDRYGQATLNLAPLVFGWIFITSLFGLGADWWWITRGKPRGLVMAITTFILAGLILYASLALFLPKLPITEAGFQTYTAHGAYLKNVYYFLPLAIVFLIIPFHFVISMQKELQAGRHNRAHALLSGRRRSAAPAGTIYIKPFWLGIILSVTIPLALVFMAHLFENLKSGEYMNLFMQLVQWRLLLFFILGMECVIWYNRALNGIKRDCLIYKAHSTDD